MVTASHNPAEDNGVKLVDPMVSKQLFTTPAFWPGLYLTNAEK